MFIIQRSLSALFLLLMTMNLALPHEEANNRKLQGANYISTLRAKYMHRLTFHNQFAEQTVNSFNIDCQTKDGRFLPLVNVLLARLASMDSKKTWMVTDVDSRNAEIRIYDTLLGKDGVLINPTISFTINKWGELRPLRIRSEAVLNACFGSYGPIYVMKEK